MSLVISTEERLLVPTHSEEILYLNTRWKKFRTLLKFRRDLSWRRDDGDWGMKMNIVISRRNDEKSLREDKGGRNFAPF